MSDPLPSSNYAFASDNCAGICPEAMRAVNEANHGRFASYGDDPWTSEAKHLFQELFECECEVFFTFNGTAANALALSACCRGSYHRVLCHESAHIETDECGAPEFFTGGAKLTPLRGTAGKLHIAELRAALHLGHGIHFPKPAAISLTQSTELGTVYSIDELKGITGFAREHGLAVQMDGARFANAVAALQSKTDSSSVTPADLTWRAGVDVLSLGGTKTGMFSTEAVVFFDRSLAEDFAYRIKQGGQLSSKMRFAAAQWIAMIRDGAWLRHAAHANAHARILAEGLRSIASVKLLGEPESNGVFVELPPRIYAELERRGWMFYRFIGEHGYRLMCSWATTSEDIDSFLRDLRAVVSTQPN